MKILTHNINLDPGVDVNDSPRLDLFDSADSLPNYTFPRRNDLAISIVCINGSLDLTYDGHTTTIKRHSIIVLLPGHLIENFRVGDDFRGFLITSSLRNFRSFLPLMSRLFICSIQYRDNPVIQLSDDELSNQILLHDLLQNKLSAEETVFDRLVINKIVEAIFCETINLYFKRLSAKVDALCNRSESLFYKFIVNVEQNYTHERTVSRYADDLCVSSKHLSSVVKELTGRTAGEWIDSYVVSEIKRLLATTDLTIQEISTRLHFANQSFFGKYFKTHTGLSPREYRAGLFK